jgi:hypothetical protein
MLSQDAITSPMSNQTQMQEKKNKQPETPHFDDSH